MGRIIPQPGPATVMKQLNDNQSHSRQTTQIGGELAILVYCHQAGVACRSACTSAGMTLCAAAPDSAPGDGIPRDSATFLMAFMTVAFMTMAVMVAPVIPSMVT